MFDPDDPWGDAAASLAFPKDDPDRDEEYKAFVRTFPCSKCGRHHPSAAHHHPPVGHSSVGIKVSDYRCVPLCVECHERVHRIGRSSFWGDLDAVEDVITRLNIRFFFLAPP